MRYDFECSACSVVFEHSCSMSAKPDVLPCQCGGEARHVILSVPESFVRGRPMQFDPQKNTPSFGRAFGRTDAEQHETYRRVIAENVKMEKARQRSHSRKDKDFEIVGIAPMEAVHSFGENVGDKEAAQKDPVDFHKRMGTYCGRR